MGGFRSTIAGAHFVTAGSTLSRVTRCALQRGARAATALLLPSTCCLCGAAGHRSDLDLCEVCVTLLPFDCATPDAIARELEARDQVATRTLAVALVPFLYAYPVDEFIRALKFRGERVYARVLGSLLADTHRVRGGETPAALVPVPLHSKRYRERGFNQAAEIARFAAVSLGIDVLSDCLVRRVATQEQSGLSVDERRRNVRDAFEVRRVPTATRIALVDDVITTGSTAMAAARALLSAGVEELELWAVARVRAHSA